MRTAVVTRAARGGWGRFVPGAVVLGTVRTERPMIVAVVRMIMAVVGMIVDGARRRVAHLHGIGSAGGTGRCTSDVIAIVYAAAADWHGVQSDPVAGSSEGRDGNISLRTAAHRAVTVVARQEVGQHDIVDVLLVARKLLSTEPVLFGENKEGRDDNHENNTGDDVH